MNAARHASRVARWHDADAIADAAIAEPAERAALMTAQARYQSARRAIRRAGRQYRAEVAACAYADSPMWQAQQVREPALPTLPQPRRDPTGLGALLHSQAYRRGYVVQLLGIARNGANESDRKGARRRLPGALRMQLACHGRRAA